MDISSSNKIPSKAEIKIRIAQIEKRLHQDNRRRQRQISLYAAAPALRTLRFGDDNDCIVLNDSEVQFIDDIVRPVHLPMSDRAHGLVNEYRELEKQSDTKKMKLVEGGDEDLVMYVEDKIKQEPDKGVEKVNNVKIEYNEAPRFMKVEESM